jgi:conjugal transfer/entry exclusion protein
LLQWHHVPAPLFQTALRLQTILDTSSSLSEHSQEITALLLQQESHAAESWPDILTIIVREDDNWLGSFNNLHILKTMSSRVAPLESQG